ncbi:MAG: cytochrome C [Candidatus Binatia bacterium]
MKPLTRRRLVLLAASILAACSQPLPEDGSATAELYRQRCGNCHHAVAPATMKFPMWEMVLPRMDKHMARARQQPLTVTERETIVAYLRRHSG